MGERVADGDQPKPDRNQPATSTEILVRRAKAGDRDALRQVIERYYSCWLKQHNGLSVAVRRGYDTQDLVQSAIVDVIEGLPKLKNEAAFFSWVTSIIRHKLAKKYRKNLKEVSLEGLQHQPEPVDGDAHPASRAEAAESYIRLLDAFLELFPRYPERMAAAYLKLLEGCSIEELEALFQCSRRTAFRWAEEGRDLLKKRFMP